MRLRETARDGPGRSHSTLTPVPMRDAGLTLDERAVPMDCWFSTFTTSPLETSEPAADVNPFVALEKLSPHVAERIATALCYADDVHTLCRCLSFGDRLVGRLEYFAVKSATSAWLDGAWLERFGFREGLECKDTFAALQEAAWAYLDELDTRKPAVALSEKWG